MGHAALSGASLETAVVGNATDCAVRMLAALVINNNTKYQRFPTHDELGMGKSYLSRASCSVHPCTACQYNSFDSHMTHLAAFAFRNTCALQAMAGAMDLDHCVHQSLKELHLQGGSFVMDDFAAKLTYLEVNNAEVHSAAECSFMNTLQRLIVLVCS